MNSDKYLIFKNKMKGLWIKKNVCDALQRANNNENENFTVIFFNLIFDL